MKNIIHFVFFTTAIAFWTAQATILTSIEKDVSDMVIGDQELPSLRIQIPSDLMCPRSTFLDLSKCFCHMVNESVMWISADFPTNSQRIRFVDNCAREFGITRDDTRNLCKAFIKKGKLPCKKTAKRLRKLSINCMGRERGLPSVNKKSKKLC